MDDIDDALATIKKEKKVRQPFSSEPKGKIAMRALENIEAVKKKREDRQN